MWLIALALPVLVTVTIAATALGVGEPSNGWTGLIGLLLVVCVVYPTLAWFLHRLGKDDGVSIQRESLLVRTSWTASVPVEKISDAYLVKDQHLPEGKFGRWKRRELQPEWREAPNVNISFREPIRLGNFPFRWYTLLCLSVNRPEELVAAIHDAMRAQRD